MAAKIEFRQQCPSCEAAVPIKDRKLIGRKIDCPKCKYRFVVADPDGEEGNGASTRRPGAKGKHRPGEGKKEAGSKRTLYLGLGLGAAAIVLLALVGFLLFGPDGSPKPSRTGPGPGSQDNSAKQEDPKKDERPAAVAVNPTNLLPNDTQGVLSVHVGKAMGNSLDRIFFEPPQGGGTSSGTPGGFRREAVANSYGLKDVNRIKRLVLASNDDEGWEFSVMTTSEPLHLETLKARLGLKPGPRSPIQGREYFLIGGELDSLSKFFFNSQNKPLALHLVNDTTLVLAHLPPLEKFLEDKGQPKLLTPSPGAADKPAGGDQPPRQPDKQPDKQPVGGAIGREIGADGGKLQPAPDKPKDPNEPKQSAAALSESYLTIHPALKAVLDRAEDGKERPISEGQLPSKKIGGFGLLLPTAGAGGLPGGAKKVKEVLAFGEALEMIRPEQIAVSETLEFKSEADARDAEKLFRTLGPELVKKMEALNSRLGLKQPVVILDEQGNVPANPDKPPAEGKPMEGDDKLTKISLTVAEKTLLVRIEIMPTPEAVDNLVALLQPRIVQAKSRIDMTSNRPRLHELAAALRAYVEKNGQFPRGVAQRKPGAERAGLPWRPDQCLSWMVELLPFLGQGEFRSLYENVNFEKSWRDPENALAAATLVPHFLAADAPEAQWWVSYPGVEGNRFAATHFVGVAGVGLDAADPEFAQMDPNWQKKIGIFGYERTTRLEDIKDGPANTIALLQVPANFKTPWTAGGGSTIRGVPEKDSVRPFVCVKYQDRMGTFAIMADGTVRFIPEDIPDEVFKALCTIAGGEPIENLDAIAPLVKGMAPVLKPTMPPGKP
jgi:hypothetical protein